MFVMSQSECCLTDITFKTIKIIKNATDSYNICVGGETVGTYDTLERAKEILNEIADKLSRYSVFYMPD